ncbi:MAG: DNA polymerase III subunit delta [Pseudomonadales bacterium]
MQLRAADLTSHLAGALAPAYLVSGNDGLLVEEACEQLLDAARGQGFSERTVLHADGGFDWNELLHAADSLSLFAERRIIDLRVSGSRFDQKASEALRRFAERPPSDTVLLIRCEQLAGKDVKAAWFKALDRVGVVLRIWPIGYRELPRWLAGRLRRAGVELQPEALKLFAERVEGNLAAAAQEVEKLKVSGLETPISAAALTSVLEDASHFDTFELLDAVFAGDAARVVRMLTSLREEGVAIFAIQGALVSQLRQISDGRSLYGARQKLLPGFLRRIGSAAAADRVLAECALIDAQGKGQIPGDPWWSLEDLLLRLCGVRPLAGTTVLEQLRRADS